MSKTSGIAGFIFLFFIILVVSTSCASLKKGKVSSRTKKSSCTLAQLVGPDTYYYSDHYKRKLKRATNRISRK